MDFLFIHCHCDQDGGDKLRAEKDERETERETEREDKEKYFAGAEDHFGGVVDVIERHVAGG
jgi:hypothetical protein